MRPLFESLRGKVEAAHLARHWRQGPHLRLHLRTDPAAWGKVVQPRIESVVGGYLCTHPSTAVLDRRAESAQHQLLAEQEHGPLSPWFPDNSIQYPPYDARLHVLHNQETADLAGRLRHREHPAAVPDAGARPQRERHQGQPGLGSSAHHCGCRVAADPEQHGLVPLSCGGLSVPVQRPRRGSRGLRCILPRPQGAPDRAGVRGCRRAGRANRCPSSTSGGSWPTPMRNGWDR
ncbi:lantibiotic dehydratase C-terminal domain-containing protein [Streptomyces sp. NPDC001667]